MLLFSTILIGLDQLSIKCSMPRFSATSYNVEKEIWRRREGRSFVYCCCGEGASDR